jgi:hypothetical protein
MTTFGGWREFQEYITVSPGHQRARQQEAVFVVPRSCGGHRSGVSNGATSLPLGKLLLPTFLRSIS